MPRALGRALLLGLWWAARAAADPGAADALEDVEDAADASTDPSSRWSQDIQMLALVLSPLVAIGGYFVQAMLERRNRARQLELERILEQIKQFYGPIYAISNRSKCAFNSMLMIYATRTGTDFDDPMLITSFLGEVKNAESSEDKVSGSFAAGLWMDFVKHTAYPLAKQIVDILMAQPHLWDGPFPPEFMQLFGLITEREMVIRQWEKQNFTRLMFTSLYPDKLTSMVEERLYQLQIRRLELVGGALPASSSSAAAEPQEAQPEKEAMLVRRHSRHSLTVSDMGGGSDAGKALLGTEGG